jgi:prepilin-type N-terminal cleavage/methylation domain-containing protein
MTASPRKNGFTLVEIIVATAIIATTLVALAHLFTIGAAQTLNNRYALPAITAAQGKLRELQALTWSYGAGAPELAVSPARTLLEDVPGYVEYLDTNTGVTTTGGRQSAAFIRRWAIRPRTSTEPDTLVLQVCVYRAPKGDPPGTCVASIRTRRP